MFKTSFATAAMLSVTQAVNTREFLHLNTNAMLAQTEAEAEGCGDSARGQPVVYQGPADYAPSLR